MASSRVPHPDRPRSIVLIGVVLALVAGCTSAGSPGPSPSPGTAAATTPCPTASIIPCQRPSLSPPVSPSPAPSASPPPNPAPSTGIGSLVADVARESADPASATEAATAVDAFAVDLFRAMASRGKNLAISPTSIAIALSMARLGARGTTADEMDAVLHRLVAGGATGPIDALDAALAARNRTVADADGVDHQVELHVANSTFAQDGLTIESAYLDAIARALGSGVRTVDFASDPNAARALINAWVADQTAQRITELLRPGDIDVLTRLVLVDALDLEAPWAMPFDATLTSPAAFTLADGSTIRVSTMAGPQSIALSLPYATGSDWQAVELPYLGGELAMTIVVPKDLPAFVDALSAERWAAIVAGLQPRPVHEVTLPRFSLRTHKDLASVLAGLGMPTAFSGQADFSGIVADGWFTIGGVIHEATVEVDERGTAASAATAIVMGDITGPEPIVQPVTVHVDRPFLFAIRDVPTGAILFLGQVADPSAG